MNQQSLFDVLEPDAGALERELFAEWEPVLHSACKELGLKQESFYLQDNKGYTSVYFNSALVARMHIRGREHYISIPDSWKESLPEGVKPKRQKDGLPEINDHSCFQTDDPRNSEFKVRLPENTRIGENTMRRK